MVTKHSLYMQKKNRGKLWIMRRMLDLELNLPMVCGGQEGPPKGLHNI